MLDEDTGELAVSVEDVIRPLDAEVLTLLLIHIVG